jgi:alpha/beta superfamily hydrolase
MPEHTLLVETRADSLGVIVTEPVGSPVASAVLLHGGGTSGRPGNNRVFARMARALADIGVVVVRADYPGQGASLGGVDVGARKGDTLGDMEAARDLSAWFRERTGGLDFFVIGSCYGARLGSRLGAEQEDIAGLALVAPAIQVLTPVGEKPARVDPGRRMKAVRALRRKIRSTSRRRRSGNASEASGVDRRVASMIDASLDKAPVWVLAGERDVFARLLPDLRQSLGSNADRLQHEIMPDMVFHAYPTPDAQRLAVEKVARWVQRRIIELRGSAKA